jgi:hypothetical protein
LLRLVNFSDVRLDMHLSPSKCVTRHVTVRPMSSRITRRAITGLMHNRSVFHAPLPRKGKPSQHVSTRTSILLADNLIAAVDASVPGHQVRRARHSIASVSHSGILLLWYGVRGLSPGPISDRRFLRWAKMSRSVLLHTHWSSVLQLSFAFSVFLHLPHSIFAAFALGRIHTQRLTRLRNFVIVGRVSRCVGYA